MPPPPTNGTPARTLAEFVTSRRRVLRLSIRQCATDAGFSRELLTKLERDNHDIGYKRLPSLASVLNVPLTTLYAYLLLEADERNGTHLSVRLRDHHDTLDTLTQRLYLREGNYVHPDFA